MHTDPYKSEAKEKEKAVAKQKQERAAAIEEERKQLQELPVEDRFAPCPKMQDLPGANPRLQVDSHNFEGYPIFAIDPGRQRIISLWHVSHVAFSLTRG